MGKAGTKFQTDSCETSQDIAQKQVKQVTPDEQIDKTVRQNHTIPELLMGVQKWISRSKVPPEACGHSV